MHLALRSIPFLTAIGSSAETSFIYVDNYSIMRSSLDGSRSKALSKTIHSPRTVDYNYR